MARTRWAYVVAALPLAVLAVDPGGLAPFGPAKWLALSTVVLMAAATCRWASRSVRVARLPMLCWGGLLVALEVAALFGVDRVYAWIGTPERHFGFVTWALSAVAFGIGQLVGDTEPRRGCPRVVVVGVAIAAGLVGVWALAETLGWQPFNLAGAGERPLGPFGSSAYLGAAAVLLGPVALGLALDRSWNRVARRAAAVAALLSSVALVASGARAAWAGCLGAAVLVLVTRRRALRVTPKRVLIVVAPVLVAVGVAFATGVAGRVPDIVTDRDGGARGRVDEWRVAVRVVARHPAVGVGPEGYRIAFGRAVDDSYEMAHGRDPLPDRAHSSLLDVAATAGLVGLAAYVALLATVSRMVVRALRRHGGWVAGAAAGVTAYAFQAVFLFPVAELELVAWLLAGLVVAQAAEPRELVDVRVPRILPVLAATFAVVALVTGALDVAADRAAKRTLRASAAGRPVDPDQAARLRPDALRYRLVAARALEDGSPAGIRQAVAQLDHALAVSPRDPVVRGERARLLLELARRTDNPGDLKTALAVLKELKADDPRNAEVLLRLGLAYALTGEDTAAEWAWLAAERLAPRSAAASVDLALFYAESEQWRDARAAARRALDREPGNELARDVLRRADDADVEGDGT